MANRPFITLAIGMTGNKPDEEHSVTPKQHSTRLGIIILVLRPIRLLKANKFHRIAKSIGDRTPTSDKIAPIQLKFGHR